MTPFQALAKLASDEQWCWNLICTTCGHLHFKFAFKELATGKSPEDENWIIRRGQTKYPELGRIPRAYSSKEKEIILEKCKGTDLKYLSQECRFPDWLGYLGLILSHMRSDSPSYKELSSEWAGQLAEIVPADSAIHSKLKTISASDSLQLSLDDLESCEQALQYQAYR